MSFYFETSPNTKYKEKKGGVACYIISPPSEKNGGHDPRVPHRIATMGSGGLRVVKLP